MAPGPCTEADTEPIPGTGGGGGGGGGGVQQTYVSYNYYCIPY